MTPECAPLGPPPAGWRTLREIDQSLGRPKGTAFRAFRAMAESGNGPAGTCWHEGPHYRLLRRQDDARAFDRLCARLYPGSLTAILLSPAMVAALAALA